MPIVGSFYAKFYQERHVVGAKLLSELAQSATLQVWNDRLKWYNAFGYHSPLLASENVTLSTSLAISTKKCSYIDFEHDNYFSFQHINCLHTSAAQVN